MHRLSIDLSRWLAVATITVANSCGLTCCAQPRIDSSIEVVDENVAGDSVDSNDTRVRENPVIDGDDDLDADIPIPSFIDRDACHVELNGADWTRARNVIATAAVQPVSILLIGDSHVQADIGTGIVRDLLQYDYGNAGRGLVAPLKLSGTNEPFDYIFTSTGRWTPAKLMSREWPHKMGFTGTALKNETRENNLTFGTAERDDDYDPFRVITIFHDGQLNVESVTDQDGKRIEATINHDGKATVIDLDHDVTRAKVNIDAGSDLIVHGASLSGERPGVFFHTIGNNGATFDTYNKIGNMGSSIKPLHPALVIISLGTNEAFGNIGPDALYRNIDRLVKDIRNQNPEAAILLTTPMECQRSVYSTSSRQVKGSRGKTKTVQSRSKGYQINAKVKEERDVILKYGRENKIATFDWYSVAGGDGASRRWIDAGLYSRDRVHHSIKGYYLSGRLLYQAIAQALNHK